MMQSLTLRFPEPDDAELILEGVRESIEELHRWMAWCHLDFSIDDARHWISAQSDARASQSAFEFLVLDPDGRLVGVCGINQIDMTRRSANFGYWVRSSETGRGIATQAAKQVGSWVFANTDVERLEIVAASGNTASQAVAIKAGATREGVLRSKLLIHGLVHDAVVFSIIRPRALFVR